MAFTQTDLTNLEAAIMAKATGDREVSFSSADKSVNLSDASLKELQELRSRIIFEIGLANGAYSPRTYARQGGRGL